MQKIALSVSIALMALLAFGDAQACSFARGYEIVRPKTYPHDKDFVPPAPIGSVKALKRGFNDGDGASCSDAGILTIAIEHRAHPEILGYSFRITSGSFPDAVFPDAVLAPIDLADGERGFRFIWLDVPQNRQKAERIDATVEVRLVSRSGEESEPRVLHIMHEGG